MDQLKVFCLDPATSPAPPQHPTLMMSMREKKAQEQNIFTSTRPVSDWDPPLDRHELTGSNLLRVLWSCTKEDKSGEMYADSGCNRCVAGKDVHAQWQEYLRTFHLQPAMHRKQEEFIFGNGEVETSDCSFEYPVFLKGKFQGTIDVARISKPCPALFSKRMMADWEVTLDFAKNTLAIRKHKVELPFKDSIPVVDIFDLPELLDRRKIPPSFRTFEESYVVTSIEEGFQGQTDCSDTKSPYTSVEDQ